MRCAATSSSPSSPRGTASADQRVVVGFVGAGFVARAHAQLHQRIPRSVVGHVFDQDAGRMEQFGQDFGARPCATQEELITRSDVVYVCTWTAQHLGTVRAVADAGKPVFCEKPLSTNLADVLSMVALVEQAGIINQIGLVLRFSPAFYILRQLRSNEDAGELLALTFRTDQYLPVGGAYQSTWRSDPSQAGSGVLLEHSIHDVDMIEYLAGPIDTVSCVTRRRHGLRGIEDVASAQFTLSNGVVASLVTVWHDLPERGDARRVELLSDRQWCVLDGSYHFGPVSWQRTGFGASSSEGAELLSLATNAGLATDNEDASFIDAVLDGRPPTPDFRVGLRAHAVVAAAYESASKAGAIVDVGNVQAR